ncbi:MAG: FAD-dependent oxidoreductase [Candidatus Omnitrophota bacterium]
MSRIIAIGQSITAVKFFEKVRNDDPDSEMVIVNFDKDLPSRPERFPDFIGKKIDRKNVVYQSESFYKNLRFEVINGKKINRINWKRKTVFFEDGQKLEGDIILVAASDKTSYPDIKGTIKEGVFSLKTIDQVDAFLAMIRRIDTVVIQSSSLKGVLWAQSMIPLQIEVVLAIPAGGILPGVLDESVSNVIISMLEKAGVRVIRDCMVAEILGESDVKAVRLNVNKVIAAESVIFPDAASDMRLFNKGELECCADAVKTNLNFETNLDNVFAIDEMADSCALSAGTFLSDDVRSILVGRIYNRIKGIETPAVTAFPCYSADLLGHDFFCIGLMNCEGAEVFVKYDDEQLLRARFIVKDNILKAAYLLNYSDLETKVTQLVQEQQPVDPSALCPGCLKEEHLLQSQVGSVGERVLVKPEIQG